MDMFVMFAYFDKLPCRRRGLGERILDGKRDSCVHIYFALKEKFSALDFFLPKYKKRKQNIGARDRCL